MKSADLEAAISGFFFTVDSKDLDRLPGPLQHLMVRAAQAGDALYVAAQASQEGRMHHWPACACACVHHLLVKQRRREAKHQLVRHLTDEIKKTAPEVLRELQGWETFRGRSARRRFMDWLLEPTSLPRGRPRQLFLGGEDLQDAAELLDHAREETPDHVRQALEATVVFPEHDPAAEGWVGTVWEPALERPAIREVFQIAVGVHELSEDRYTYVRDARARAVVAALAGVSEAAVQEALDELEEPKEPQVLAKLGALDMAVWLALEMDRAEMDLGSLLAEWREKQREFPSDEDIQTRLLEKRAQDRADMTGQSFEEALVAEVARARLREREGDWGSEELVAEKERLRSEDRSPLEIWRDDVSDI